MPTWFGAARVSFFVLHPIIAPVVVVESGNPTPDPGQLHGPSYQRSDGPGLESDRLRKLGHAVREGYARSQVTKLKTECFQDELPLDPGVATILLEWKRLCIATQGDRVCPSSRTNRPYDSGTLRKNVLKTAARARQRSEIHRLAHAAAQLPRWLDETGAPLGVQQNYASREHLDSDERLWWRPHRIEAQKPIYPWCSGYCFKTAPNSKRPSPGRPLI
jgi:hypothetical protein